MVEEKENNKKHLEHHGTEFHNVSSRQQHRQLDSIQSKARQALWFVETYGLQITGVSLADKKWKVRGVPDEKQHWRKRKRQIQQPV